MALGAVLAAALTDHSSRRAALWVAGGDVLRQPGVQGNGYGAPLETIVVDEAGPGGVSALTFTIEDPLKTCPTPAENDDVLFWDIGDDVPIFAGYVQDIVEKPLGPAGRTIDVTCSGREIELDWATLTADVTLARVAGAGDLELYAAAQTLVAASIGHRGLNAASNPIGGLSETARPISIFSGVLYGGIASIPAPGVTIRAGTTLREALRQATAGATRSGGSSTSTPPVGGIDWTVDFYGGLRGTAIGIGTGNQRVNEYVELVVTDSVASSTRTEQLEHEIDASQLVRGVYVAGANAAGSGLFMDGSGKYGKIAYLSDPTIDTAQKAVDAAASYLGQYTVRARGSFKLTDWRPVQSPTSMYRPLSVLTLTDNPTDATGGWLIMEIEKTFTGNGETWTITYGGLAPSAAVLLRRLTRTIR